MVDRVIKLEGRGLRGESYADTARRSGLFGILPTDDDETVIGKINADAAASADRAELAAEQATDLVLPENRFVAADLATARSDGEAATTAGTYFIAVGEAEGEAEVRLRTAGGSDLIYTEITKSGLASPDPGKGAALIGVSPNETAADVFAQEVRITTFGAKFDVADHGNIANATDDTDAWEAALDYLELVGGGTLDLPPGASKITRQITIPNVPIRISGSGRRKVYPGLFAAGTPCPSTVVPVHTGRCAFRFLATANGHGGFCAENFNVATLETGDMPTTAFGWETQGGFLYGFTFWRVGVHGFTSAFDTFANGGSERAVGNVVIENCTINRNKWIARSLDGTQFNSFRFRYNEAGQNGYLPGDGGISISGHNVSINENILESNRDAIYLYGTYNAVEVKGNYFENNVGTACVHVSNAVNYDIGPNNYGMGLPFAGPSDDPETGPYLAHKVYLFRCHLGDCIDPYWAAGVNKMSPPLLGRHVRNNLNTNATDFQLLRADRLDGGNYAVAPVSTAGTQQASSGAREINPQTGNPMPVVAYTTSGNGSVAGSVSLSGASGQWVGFSWLVRRMTAAGAAVDPFITLLPDNDFGRRVDLPVNNFRHCWQAGEWALISGAFRLDDAQASINYLIYPYGINPTVGWVARMLRPYFYVMDDVNHAVPFIDNMFVERVSAAPTTGTWQTGDILRNSAGGFWKCTAGGTPGTWAAI